jgi:sterol 14-demethylase
MFIGMMFAGHHTTSGTAAWTLIELLRHPDQMAAVIAELDELYADGSAGGTSQRPDRVTGGTSQRPDRVTGGTSQRPDRVTGGTSQRPDRVTVSFQALREIPLLESAIKEALRLHPPLILLLRVATEDLEVGGFTIRKGELVAASPAVSNRLPSDFPDAEAFDPSRYLAPRREDDVNPWTWIPFGGGRHRCVGAAFAMMQLKAIFSVLLRHFTFELAQPPDSYRNDHSKMVVQLQQPCRARVQPREVSA